MELNRDYLKAGNTSNPGEQLLLCVIEVSLKKLAKSKNAFGHIIRIKECTTLFSQHFQFGTLTKKQTKLLIKTMAFFGYLEYVPCHGVKFTKKGLNLIGFNVLKQNSEGANDEVERVD